MVKDPPAGAGDVGCIPDKEDLQEKAMAVTPVFLPGKSHKQGSLGGLQSMGSQRVGYD